MLKLVRNDNVRENSELAVRSLGTDPHSVDGVRLKSRDLGDRVRSNLDTQPALEVVVGVRAVVDTIADHTACWH